MIVDLTMMLFLALVSYCDLKHSRIPNRLIIAMGFFGVLLKVMGMSIFKGNFYLVKEGASFSDSLAGFFIPFLLLLPLWLIRAIGAGDIKLLMTLGLVIGKDILIISFYSFLTDALVGLFYLVKGGVLKNRLLRITNHFILMANEKKVLKYDGGIDSANAVAVAFAPCVLVAMAFRMISQILNGGIM